MCACCSVCDTQAEKKAPAAASAAPAAAKADAAAKSAAAAAPEEGAAGTADDPYAFMPKPEDNNQVRQVCCLRYGALCCAVQCCAVQCCAVSCCHVGSLCRARLGVFQGRNGSMDF